MKIEHIYKIKHKRKFLNYNFILNKIFLILGYNYLIKYINKLKSDKLYEKYENI